MPSMVFALPFPDIGPDLFSFEVFGFTIALRYYALAYIFGILIGWWMAVRTLKVPALWKDNTPAMTTEQMEAFVTWLVVGIIAGGRLGFVLFYRPGYYLENPGDIIRVWDGGMAFHGGLIGVILACYIFARKHGITYGKIGDLACLCTPPGLFLGRVANFINGELWGKGTDVPWAFVFPSPASQVCPGIEGICARHPSQLYEAILEGLILGGLLLYMVWRRGALKTPWVIFGTFFAGYGISRFIVEFFRQADPQFMSETNPAGYVIQFTMNSGLQMGQLLSLPMIILGVGVVIWARRRAQTSA